MPRRLPDDDLVVASAIHERRYADPHAVTAVVATDVPPVMAEAIRTRTRR